MRNSRYNPESEYNRWMRRIEKEYSPFTHDGEVWTNEQNDHLLEAWLVDECCYLSARTCLLQVTGRSLQACMTQLWKLAVRYQPGASFLYEPICRSRRTGEFTARELALIGNATDKEGRKHGGYLPERISKVVGRPESEILSWMKDQAEKRQKRMLVPIQTNRGESEEHKLARVVHEVVKNYVKTIQQLIDEQLGLINEFLGTAV